MTMQSTELEIPALGALLDFWLARCVGGNPPLASAISPVELRDWKDHIAVFEVFGDGDFVYSYYGKALEEAFGHSRLGATLDDLPDEPRAILWAEYAAVCRERLPVARVHTASFDGVERSFERLVLPLGSDGGAVDKLIVAAYEIPRTATADAVETPSTGAPE